MVGKTTRTEDGYMDFPFMQDPLLGMGLVIFFGYFLGHLAVKAGLPKITGYLAAGLILNPTVFGLVPQSAIAGTNTMVNVLLCVITFEIGGSLAIDKIRSLGKSIVAMTVLEAEGAFLAVILGMIPFCVLFGSHFGISGTPAVLAFSILMGGLVSPTDPAATIAVAHQYGAKGPVTSTILGVSAFDDGFGIINFGLALALARTIMGGGELSLFSVVISPLWTILLSAAVGCVFGIMVDRMSSKALDSEGGGGLTIVLVGGLMACFGVAEALKADELLATMVMGIWVVNANNRSDEIFDFVQSTLEEPVFLIFFCVSGMTLDMPSLLSSLAFIPAVVLLRVLGKAAGIYGGGDLTGVDGKTCRYVIGGLIPLGGIVIGLALTLKRFPEMAPFADTLINVIIGCTVIHEFIGPMTARWALNSSGEIDK
ncbi:cation:proton antiporter [Dethiosulfovibrio faecalis]|uniref:cation:proton antiporter n=1 Tax=Dethiosulfovibrio faecalis TaxID=2720018 RepID=UPI001F1AD9ED|nr:cation:proton antiporter [Dethiosulfovibrio faecalis]